MKQQMTIRIEDMASCIELVKDMLENYDYEADDSIPVISAAVTLLRQTHRYFVDLSGFIEKNLGELVITVPVSGKFYFDQLYRDQPQFLGVELKPKKGTEA